MTDQIAPPQSVFVVSDTTSDLKRDGRAVIIDFQVGVQGEEWQQHRSDLCAAISRLDQFSCAGTKPYWIYPETESDSDILAAVSGGLQLYVRWRRELDGPKADRATLLEKFHSAQQGLLAKLAAQLSQITSGKADE